jgi:hypothetical protein
VRDLGYEGGGRGRGKREEGRGKREEGRGRREEEGKANT